MIKPHAYPVIGCWYHDLEHQEPFEVVAIDHQNQLIEIQYFSGEIEEYESEDWFLLPMRMIPPPQDWSGPFEVEKGDFPELSDEPYHPHPPSTDDME